MCCEEQSIHTRHPARPEEVKLLVGNLHIQLWLTACAGRDTLLERRVVLQEILVSINTVPLATKKCIEENRIAHDT